jgi:lantibiotic modifying enzyme
MRLDSAALAGMVASASTLDERMGGAFEPLEPDGGAEGEARLARWALRVADGDPRRFRRRLRAEGWSVADARAALGPVRPREGAALPAWARAVAEAAALPAAAGPPDRALRADAPVPFQDVLLPFVRLARRRVEAHPRVALLEAPARACLERALLRRLAGECAEALGVERAAFGAVGPGAGGDAAFAAWTADGGLAALAGRLPVLARLLGTHLEHWVAATAELLDRLAADRRLLRAAFAGGRPLGRVRAVAAALSDPHRGGRTVSVLEFASGCRVVYKPRPLGVDAAWQALLRWLAGRTSGPAPRPLAVLDRGAYGWMEHAAPRPCRSAREEARYHERAGALLCLAYALGGSDLHAENVAAAGPHPVLVDLEMLLAAPRRGAGGGAAAAHVASVLRTGLLPQWVPGLRGAARREGGLAASPPRCEDPRRVEAGFARTYRALLRLREPLLAPGGPLEALAGVEVRVLVRATRVYGALLRRARHPAFLGCGVDRDLEMDALCRPWLAPGAPRGPWAALRAERVDLAVGDVPLFTAGACATRVRDARGAGVGALRERPGHAEAVRRLRGLSPADLAAQRRLIRLAFGEARPPAEEAYPLDGAAFTREAAALAEQLVRTAQAARRGGLTWLAPVDGPGEARFAPAGLDLAHGRTGTALFLAACAGAEAGGGCREAALAAIEPLLRGLREPGCARRLATRLGIGGADGVGGVVYALVRIAGFLGDEAPLRAAGAAAAALSPAAVAADRSLDVYSGSAGAALALLALHAATGCGDALQRADGCGRHLLAHGGAVRGGGFAHGAAGVAHALLRLHRATGDAAFRAGAEDAFAAAARARDAGARSPAWCRGAAGTLLARAAAGDLPGAAARRGRLAARAAAAGRAPLQPADAPCCGNLGTIELLLVAADRLERPALREAALARAGQVVRRAWTRRSYATGVEDRYVPGFLQGTAGIGYGLLRLGDPARFPSVLLWE